LTTDLTLESLQVLLKELVALDAELPPAPWTPDIDDEGTEHEEWTGKMYHLPDGSSTPLYDGDVKLARNLALLRNLVPRLVAALVNQ
jgi:hypothetical protein